MTSGSDKTEVDPEKSRINQRRRQLIATVGTGVAAGVAGCGGGGGNDTDTPDPGSDETDDPGSDETDDPGTGTDTDGTGTDTDTAPAMTERTFRTFHNKELAETTFSLYDHREGWPRMVNSWAHAYKGSFNQQTSELMPMLVTDWSADAETIELTFRESGWSDGSGNVLPRDWGIPEQLNRWQSETRPEDLSEDNPPEDWQTATSSIEWDETTLRFVSEDGWYDRFVTDNIIQGMLTNPANINLGIMITLPADPYFAPIWEEAQEMGNWEERKARIDEWDNNEVGEHLPNWSQNNEGNYVPDNPTEQPNSGPFSVTDITETEITLEKNENYWNADQINWEEVRVDTMLEQRQRNQAMTSNELDGINGQLYTPQATILDQLGDNWDWHRHNPDNTLGLSLNANSVPWLEDARVRQAIYLALDKEELARQGHEYANQAPPNPPGLNHAAFNQLLPDDAPVDSFDQYEFDQERATGLMEAAGFSMQGGSWVTPEGEETSLELIADAQSPEVPALIEDQLNNFGISMSLTTNEGTVVDESKGSGDFQAGMKNWWVDHQLMWARMIQQSDRRNRFGIFSQESVDEFVDEYSDEGVENVEYEWTNNIEGWEIDQWRDFTLSIPEIGERPIDTDPSEFRDVPVIYYGYIFENNLDREELSQWALELCWAFNWYLPYLPFSVTNQLAVQHHGRWDAPTEDQPWMQSRPMNKLVQQGDLHANPE